MATEGKQRVGLATTAHYGRQIAWIGNVVVGKKYRQRHIGQRLVEHAIKYLSRMRVRHIALYSFKENFRFYRNLGFVQGAAFVRLRREPEARRLIFAKGTPFKALALSSVLSMDRKAFGADRRHLITCLLDAGTAWYLGFRIGPSGSYVVVKTYRDMNEIGPWVSFASDSRNLESLLRLVIDRSDRKPIEASCPVTNRQALRIMKKNHFHTIHKGRVMFYGQVARIGQPSAIVAHGFLDKG